MTSPQLEAFAAKAKNSEAPRAYRIRRCKGNQSAWCLISLRTDGTEIDSHGGYKTGLSFDSLFANPHSPHPRSGDKIEVVL